MTALTEHLKKYNLGLKERDPILGDGNCWYSTNVDLIKLYDMKAPREANELRKAVTNSLLDHPQKMYWIKTQFRGKSQKISKSIKEQSTPGTFIDRNGIMVVATADYLNVSYHIAGTSNNSQSPVTKLCDECPNRRVFHVGYYQDTTDRDDVPKKAGHYQSLEIPDMAVPCCGIAEPATQPQSVQVDTISEPVEKLRSEEKILSIFSDDAGIVKMAMERIQAIENVSVDVLFATDVSQILYEKIRPAWPASTHIGKLCRKILEKFQDLCRASADYVREELLNITDISEDEEETNRSVRSRSFRTLFTRNPRESTLMSTRHVPEFHNSAVVSSTVIRPDRRPVLSDQFEVSNNASDLSLITSGMVLTGSTICFINS